MLGHTPKGGRFVGLRDVRISRCLAVAPTGRRVPLLVLRPGGLASSAPGVLWIHGGGYFLGMKEMALHSRALDLVRNHGAVVVSPGYRLAWRAPYPAAFDDCYAALLFLRDHALELGVRPNQVFVGGESAGGGLAAAVCMAARDRGEAHVAFQVPLYPMLSNLDTASSAHNRGHVWNTRRNHLGWRLYLRGHAKDPDISPYASPSRQINYAGLPPAYTFVGDGEPFYTETLDYIANLANAGVEARVDVYPCDTHAFDMLHPGWDISRQAIERFNEQIAYAVGHYWAAQGE